MGRVFKENSVLEKYYELWMQDSGSSDDLWAFITQHPLHGRILDLGCGSGMFTFLCAPYAQWVCGLDISHTMIAKAQANNPFSHVTFVHDTMRAFSFDQPFDRILAMNDVLNFCDSVEELHDVIACVYNHLRVGGIFTFDVHHPERLDEAGYSESGVLHGIEYEYMLERDAEKLRHTFLWYESDYPTLEVFVQTLFDHHVISSLFDPLLWELHVVNDVGETGFAMGDKWMVQARRIV